MKIIAPVTKLALIFSPIAAQTMKGTAACKKSWDLNNQHRCGNVSNSVGLLLGHVKLKE